MGCFHAHCKFQKPDSISFPDQTENLLLKLTIKTNRDAYHGKMFESRFFLSSWP